MNTETSSRRFDLDWLRVVAIGAIFIYHTTRFFTAEGWFVHNAVSYPWLEDIAELPKLFAMPLIFVVSGMSLFLGSVRLARPRHTQPGSGAARVWRTIADKILRLGIPYALAVFTHSAWQVYLERITNGEFQDQLGVLSLLRRLYMLELRLDGLHRYVMTLLLFTVLVLPVLQRCRPHAADLLAWLANSGPPGLFSFWQSPSGSPSCFFARQPGEYGPGRTWLARLPGILWARSGPSESLTLAM
jgi:peptidoglycan/LPS O-acetylase OafA/YrhL